MDTKGRFETPLVNGNDYLTIIIEEYSRFTDTFPIKSKKEASELVNNFTI